MRRAKYLALNIKLGLAGSYPLSDDRIRFHDKVVRLVYGSKKHWSRTGLVHTSPFDNDQIASNTAYITQLIRSAIEEAFPNSPGKFDVLLVDFSNNEFGMLREPILMQLADVFDALCLADTCNNFVLLLPEMPAEETASIQHFSTMETRLKMYRLAIISNDGGHLLIPKKGWKLSSIKARYATLMGGVEEDASKRFENKIVRRLGHFKRARHNGGCRLYSYTTDNCKDELLELIKIWWSKRRAKPKAIIYDSRTSPSLAMAIKAFAVLKNLYCQRVVDVIGFSRVAKEASEHNPCLLMLDVVETGETLVRYAKSLEAVGVEIVEEVLAGIIKGSSKQMKIAEFAVTGFSCRPKEPETTECVQCRLGLPTTSDDEEEFLKIRSFDLWHMASTVDWEPEPDVPDNIGLGYEVVPRFSDMLKKYGDWIAYKMERICTRFSHPDNFFVIHPDETGASAVSDKLWLRFQNKLSVIKVPRDAIKSAQNNGGEWKTVLREWDGDDTWVRQLNSLGDASAVITDIFNGSGSTFKAILDLLNCFDVEVFCYFPFVDRDCGVDDFGKYHALRYSLYDWYGPRYLKGQETS